MFTIIILDLKLSKCCVYIILKFFRRIRIKFIGIIFIHGFITIFGYIQNIRRLRKTYF